MQTHHRVRRNSTTTPRHAVLAIAAISFALAGCSSGDNDIQALSDESSASTESSEPPPTTIALAGRVTTPLSTEPPRAEASAEPSTASSSEPGSGAESSITTNEVLPLRNEVPLEAGATYETAQELGRGFTVRFSTSVDGTFATQDTGLITTHNDEFGLEGTVSIVHLDEAVAIKNPIVDFATIVVTPESYGLVQPTDDPHLEWFAQRPAVTAGPIEETTVAGYPARRMKYEVGELDGSFGCTPDDERGCLAWLFLPAGWITTSFEGDSGTMYELTVAGQRLMIDVLDAPNSTEIFESIEFVLSPSVAGYPDALELPFEGALDPDLQYVLRSVRGEPWIVPGGLNVFSSGLRGLGARFGTTGIDPCLSISAASETRWIHTTESVVLSNPGRPTPGPPVPDDPVAALGESDLLEVASRSTTTFGDVEAVVVDVTARSETSFLTNTGLAFWVDKITKVAVVPHGNTIDLVMVIAGSECEAVFNGLIPA